MKLIKLIFWAGIISGSLFCISCSKTDDENDDKLPEGQIVMKITPNWNNNVYFVLIAQTVSIDWGDGNIEYPTLLNERETALSHKYDNQNMQTVTMKTSGLTYLDAGINHSGIIYELSLGKCPKLSYLDCLNNQLTNLDVSKNTALTVLYCYHNQITSLDVSKNTALATLWCHHNQLTNLDVSKNTALTVLDCSGNQLTNLDVSKNTALTTLDCGGNQLTNLDVSKNTALRVLRCDYNQITSLDVSKNTALIELRCSNNQLTAAALNALFGSLPIKTSAYGGQISISGNPGADACNKSIAENKGWRVL